MQIMIVGIFPILQPLFTGTLLDAGESRWSHLLNFKWVQRGFSLITSDMILHLSSSLHNVLLILSLSSTLILCQ